MKAFETVWGLPIQYAAPLEAALAHADAALLLTGWEEFRVLRGRTTPRIYDWRHFL